MHIMCMEIYKHSRARGYQPSIEYSLYFVRLQHVCVYSHDVSGIIILCFPGEQSVIWLYSYCSIVEGTSDASGELPVLYLLP
jgi:hypothetical protein